MLASRAAVQYISDAVQDAAVVSGTGDTLRCFDERYDAALRESELAHLVVGPQLALDHAPDLATTAATLPFASSAAARLYSSSYSSDSGTAIGDGSLERLVILAERGAYIGAAVQPIAGRESDKPATADRSLLAVACHYYFIELCLSEPDADELPDDELPNDKLDDGTVDYESIHDAESTGVTGAAAASSSSESLMERLLRLDANAARCQDEQGRLPLHYLCQMAAVMTSDCPCPSAAHLRRVRARCLRGAVACARRLLCVFPEAATSKDLAKHTPLSWLLYSHIAALDAHHFYDAERVRERRCIYRPLVALLINMAPESLTTLATSRSRSLFSMLRRMIVPVSTTIAPTAQELDATAVAVRNPVDAFVRRDSNEDPSIATARMNESDNRSALLEPSTIGLFREVCLPRFVVKLARARARPHLTYSLPLLSFVVSAKDLTRVGRHTRCAQDRAHAAPHAARGAARSISPPAASAGRTRLCCAAPHRAWGRIAWQRCAPDDGDGNEEEAPTHDDPVSGRRRRCGVSRAVDRCAARASVERRTA